MPGPVGVTLTGLADVMRNAEAAAERAVAAAGVALYAVANNMAGDSQQITPVDTGNLRASHYVTHPQAQGRGQVVVEIGVGTTAESYAVEQHEINMPHREGEWKFLEKGIQKNQATMGAMIAAFARQALESGTTPSLPSTGMPGAPREGAGEGRGFIGPRQQHARVSKPKKARARRLKTRRKKRK